MADKSKIEWCDATWNPVTGCTKVSAGCAHCYAERMVMHRFGGTLHGSADFGKVALHHDRLDQPRHWRKPRRVFVCSMGDLFHEDVPDSFIASVVARAWKCPQHTFLVLTKRPDRMARFFAGGLAGCSILCAAAAVNECGVFGGKFWPPDNLWPGTSVENLSAISRLDDLRNTQAAIRFVSFEPLLGDIGRVDLSGIGWVICGGESGPGARPMHPDWARSLRDQCVAANVPFLFKQWGEWASPFRAGEALGEYQISGDANGRKPFCPGCAVHKWGDNDWAWRIGKKAAGRELDGRTWDQYPEPQSS